MKNRKLLALLLAGTFTLTACNGGSQPATTTPAEPAETTETATTTETGTKPADNKTATTSADVTTLPEVSVSIEEAIDAMMAHFNITEMGVVSVDFDRDNGKYTYEIEGQQDGTEYEAEIDANTGEILESESDTDDMEDVVIDFASIISPEEAMEKALEGQEGAYVEGWDLEIEDGRTRYEIDIENGSDKDVDAVTGEVYND